VEHLLFVDKFGQLHHVAMRAERRLELEEMLFRILLGFQKTIGNRHLAERHEWFDLGIADQTGVQAESFRVSII
jgi:hypothetical protein